MSFKGKLRNAIKSQGKCPLAYLRNWLAQTKQKMKSLEKNKPVAKDASTDVVEPYANVVEALLGEGIKWFSTNSKKKNSPGPELKEEKKEEGNKRLFTNPEKRPPPGLELKEKKNPPGEYGLERIEEEWWKDRG